MRRLGLLGGTFDPIHHGHIDAAAAAHAALGLTDVWILPSHRPPHRPQPVASGYHRFAMVTLAVAGRAGWRASDLELVRPEPSYTSETLACLHAEGWRPDELVFILGADAFADLESWHAFPAVLEMANFAVVSRPGVDTLTMPMRLPAVTGRVSTTIEAAGPTTIVLLDRPTTDVSATAIRRRLADGQSIAGLVPAEVAQHIGQHGLYAAASGDATDVPRPPTRPAARLHGKD